MTGHRVVGGVDWYTFEQWAGNWNRLIAMLDEVATWHVLPAWPEVGLPQMRAFDPDTAVVVFGQGKNEVRVNLTRQYDDLSMIGFMRGWLNPDMTVNDPAATAMSDRQPQP